MARFGNGPWSILGQFGHELNFMDEFATVEDVGEAMRAMGLRQCTCTLLWGVTRPRHFKG